MSAAALIAFLVVGWSGGTIGPAIPSLAAHWGVKLDQAGALFTALFLGACVTVALSGLLVDRIGRKPVLVAGLVLMALGLGGLVIAPGLAVALFMGFVLGLGIGALDVTLNVFVSDLYPLSRGPALNLMNVAFGVGALVAPLAVGLALNMTGAALAVFVFLGIAAFVNGVLLASLRFPPHPASEREHDQSLRSNLALLRQRYLLLVTLLLFLYVGMETGFGGWVYSFATHGAGLDAASAVTVPTTFWVIFTLGRVVAGFAARRLAGAWLVLIGAGIAAAGMAVIVLFSTSAPALYLGSALVGAGFAPVFPTAFGLASERYPLVAGTVSSLIVLGGTLGGAVLPYVVGLLLVEGGVPLAAGFSLLTILVLMGLQVVLIALFPFKEPDNREGLAETMAASPPL